MKVKRKPYGKARAFYSVHLSMESQSILSIVVIRYWDRSGKKMSSSSIDL